MKKVIITIAIALTINAVLLLKNISRDKAQVVFCDIGQGDATYIRLPEKIDVLIDTGPHKKILTCLSKHMPYFDRKIEMVFLTHPQKDHVGGLVWLFQSYKIENIFVPSTLLDQKFDDHAYWQELKKTVQSHKTTITYLNNAHTIKLDRSVIDILSPQKMTRITNIKKDINNIGLVMKALVNDKSILLTADVDYEIVERLLQGSIDHVTFLKIGHHGSKTSTSIKLLQLAHPTVAVISAGKFNSYGHPHKNVLLSIQSLNIPIKRTDVDGDVFFSLEKDSATLPKSFSSLEK